MTVPLPTAKAAAEIVGGLLGKTLKMEDGPFAAVGPVLLATFELDAGGLAGLMAADMSFAANSGAALTMVPPAAAGECVRAQKLNDVLKENYAEVCNVCSRLLMEEGSPHLKFKEVKVLAPNTPKDQDPRAKAKANHAFKVDIPGYGKGALAFFSML